MNKAPLESAFQTRVMKRMRLLKNTWARKISDRTQVGVPDILACVNGRFVALELKRDEKSKATPLQLHNLEEIARAGGVSLVVSPAYWDETWEMLKNLAGGLK